MSDLKSVRICSSVAESQETLDLKLSHHLRTMLRALKREEVYNMRQTTLDSFFRA